MRSSRSKKLQIGQVLVMSGYMTSRDLQIVLEAQSMLRDRTIDLNLAIQCIKVARKIGGNFSDVLEDYDATAAQRARTGKLGELLSEAGLVGEEDLSEAMERSVNTGMPLGRMLVLNRILPSEVLQRALEVQVRLRDEVVTREEAILELRQAAGLEGEPPKTVVEDKKKPIVRLGELLVMAGILNENDVMDALEWGLANQQPIGIVLVSQELITKELLDAALFFQNHVRDGKMDAMKACELLSEVFSTGATPEEVMADATPSRTRQEPEFPPISYQQLITMSRVVTDEQIEGAFDLKKQNAALIGKVLVLTGLMDVPTLQNTLRCFQMVAKGWLTPDDAIASLDYCLHQNADMPMAFEQALRELKWNPDTGLKMRGEPGATESSTSIPVLTDSGTAVPALKSEPAESASKADDEKRELAPAAAHVDEAEIAESEKTTEIKKGEVNGSEPVDLEKTVDQPLEKPEKVAVGSAKEATAEATAEGAEPMSAKKSSEPATAKNEETASSRKGSGGGRGETGQNGAEPGDDDEPEIWNDPNNSLTAPLHDEDDNAGIDSESKSDGKTTGAEPSDADPESKAETVEEATADVASNPNDQKSEAEEFKPETDKKEAEEVEAEPAKAEAEPEKAEAESEKVEAESAKAAAEAKAKAEAEAEAEATKAEPEPVAAEKPAGQSEPAAEKSQSSGVNAALAGPSLASALKSLYDDDADEDEPAAQASATEAPAAEKADADSSAGGLKHLLNRLIASSDDDEEEPAAAAVEPEPVAEPAAVAKKAEGLDAIKAQSAKIAEKLAESKEPVAEQAQEPASVSKDADEKLDEKGEAQKTSDAIAADATASLEDSLDAIVIAAKTAQEAAELAAVEDVAAMSAEELLVEIMKSAQNPNLKPATKRGGRFSETILPEDAKARQLAKLVGREASKDLADKLAFDSSGEETPEAVDTAFGRLAETYFEQGNYKEAQVIYERMLVHRLNDLGPDNPLLVEDYNNLAMTLCVQGRFDKAEPFMKRAVHLYESGPKQDPVEHADYLHSLGTIQYKLDKHKDAEEIMLKVVSIRREALEEDHEDIGRALADYAKVLKKLGKDESAEAIYKKAREILKKHKD